MIGKKTRKEGKEGLTVVYQIYHVKVFLSMQIQKLYKNSFHHLGFSWYLCIEIWDPLKEKKKKKKIEIKCYETKLTVRYLTNMQKRISLENKASSN